MYCTADPETGIVPENLRYLFKLCVQATVDTALAETVWRRSLDDRLIDYETGVDLDGYARGVKWQVLYPGAKIVSNSAVAERWSQALGAPFHEIRFETNAHNFNLVFSELEVTNVEPGYSPFTVGVGGPDFKFPLS